jgi:hypothetical protein
MKLIIFAISFPLFISALTATPCTSGPPNLVTNCGFETGSFSGWTLSGYDSAPGYQGIDYGVDASDAHSGLYGAYLGAFGGVLNLSQSLSVTPGTNYTISFWIAQSPMAAAPYLNSFSVSFGSSNLLSLTQAPNVPFTQYSFIAQASSAAATLMFGFRDDLGFFSIDDISVAATIVPEPAVGRWQGFTVLALGACSWLKKRSETRIS